MDIYPEPGKIRGIQQAGMPPYTMHCMWCGEEWDPKPKKADAEVTDTVLDRSANAHWKKCNAS